MRVIAAFKSRKLAVQADSGDTAGRADRKAVLGFDLLERGALRNRRGTVLLANLSAHIADREMRKLEELTSCGPGHLCAAQSWDASFAGENFTRCDRCYRSGEMVMQGSWIGDRREGGACRVVDRQAASLE
ncbi:MAG: hypothetical protein ACREMY_26315, partial [bacterium]